MQSKGDPSLDRPDVDANPDTCSRAVLTSCDQDFGEVQRDGKRSAEMLGELHRDRDREHCARRDCPTFSLALRPDARQPIGGDQRVKPSAIDTERAGDNGCTVCAQIIQDFRA